MRFVIISHAHPRFSKGGGELAAWFQYQGLKAAGHEVYFMARAASEKCNPGLEINYIGDNEYLFASKTDFFIGTSLELNRYSALVHWFEKHQPDVVHFHHYIHLGVELIRMIRRLCPMTKIVLTLHEFGAICPNHGQMMKKNNMRCYKSSPRECQSCFPEISLDDFFLREQYIKSFFKLVDIFISPSEFLKQRYIHWGLPLERFFVLENGLPTAPRVPIRNPDKIGLRGRFAFFGQVIPYKGLDIILEAVQLLPKKFRSNIRLSIYGSNDDTWFQEYSEKINTLLDACSDVARFHGPYEPHEMPDLMAEIDWVIMASIWWENSPLVIQEAYTYGRPIICANIGGMAEKVRDGFTGRHFRAGDPASLADVMMQVLSFSEDTYEAYVNNLPIPWGIDNMIRAYLDVITADQ